MIYFILKRQYHYSTRILINVDQEPYNSANSHFLVFSIKILKIQISPLSL